MSKPATTDRTGNKNMVTIKRREYQPRKFTNDIYLRGKLYVSAVSDEIVDEIAFRVRMSR